LRADGIGEGQRAIERNGEAASALHLVRLRCGGHDADEAAGGVDQRSAGIAGPTVGVQVDQVRESLALPVSSSSATMFWSSARTVPWGAGKSPPSG
jgi:hypothetical protein